MTKTSTKRPPRPVRGHAAVRLALVVAMAGLSGLTACAADTSGILIRSGVKGTSALAELKPTQGQKASGIVVFSAEGQAVRVRVQASGLTPHQTHGFHVHEKGDCSSPDANSAGGHFNPASAPHGPPDGPHHAGDMPALTADAAGDAQASFTLTGVSLGRGPADLIGKAVVVHAQPDDYRTQPTGNSGARIACGVIAAASSR